MNFHWNSYFLAVSETQRTASIFMEKNSIGYSCLSLWHDKEINFLLLPTIGAQTKKGNHSTFMHFLPPPSKQIRLGRFLILLNIEKLFQNSADFKVSSLFSADCTWGTGTDQVICQHLKWKKGSPSEPGNCARSLQTYFSAQLARPAFSTQSIKPVM